ncbi:MAG: diacylglycerol kinase [Oscillospiraceae bacterium]|nr:diacylglycerol kinase [Oscillospiraceae bacterium]
MKAFFRSFRYAFRGLRACVRERNFRFELAIFGYMIGFLTVYDWFQVSRAEWAVLLLAAAAVLAAEAFNTAVEAAVDLASPGRHPLAARAKDAAAGAVLLAALGAIAAGVAVLGQPAAFRRMFHYYQQKPWMLAVLGLSGVLAGLFVFYPKKGRKQ